MVFDIGNVLIEFRWKDYGLVFESYEKTYPEIMKILKQIFCRCPSVLLRSGSGGLCLLLCTDEAFVQKEILDSDVLDAVFILPGFHIIFYNYNFLERVGDSDQGSNFLFPFVRVCNG